MNHAARGEDIASGNDFSSAAQRFKREFWSKENLRFSQPHYRLEKSARIINLLAQGKDCTLLDVGCGPATLSRLLTPNIEYYGLDIAIQVPAPNLIEEDFLVAPIKFADRKFDIIIAQGIFEYVGDLQAQKFAEIAQLLTTDGTFIVTYWNFGHRRKHVALPFSNVQPIGHFQRDLANYFHIDRSFPASHNWRHGSPNRRLIKAVNMHVNRSIPFVSPLLAVEYFFICSSREKSENQHQ
jgi:SAM-dependent methyltransferase